MAARYCAHFGGSAGNPCPTQIAQARIVDSLDDDDGELTLKVFLDINPAQAPWMNVHII